MTYLVIENMPGYLPESDPIECETLEDAQQVLKDIREEWLEAGYSPFAITGSYKDGWYWLGDSRIAEIVWAEL